MRQIRSRSRYATLVMAALMSVLALTVRATELVATPEPVATHKFSVGAGFNGAGTALEGHWLRASGWGLFFGLSSNGSKEDINIFHYLGQGEIGQNKSSFHFGLAWRHSTEVTLGLGAGVQQTEWVQTRYGSLTTEQSARLHAPPERTYGPHGFAEFGITKPLALQIQAGPAGVGMSVHIHF